MDPRGIPKGIPNQDPRGPRIPNSIIILEEIPAEMSNINKRISERILGEITTGIPEKINQ